MKKAILVHGWEGDPENNWFPWLKKELINRGYEVVVPELPDSDHPKIETWLKTLTEAASEVDEETIFIGHSLGCQTILRYLEKLPSDKKVGTVICVAGFFALVNLEGPEQEALAKPWLEMPIDTDKVKTIANKIVLILSDDDQWVKVDPNQRMFEEKLGAQVVVEHGQGHFDDDHFITQLPRILDFID